MPSWRTDGCTSPHAHSATVLVTACAASVRLRKRAVPLKRHEVLRLSSSSPALDHIFQFLPRYQGICVLVTEHVPVDADEGVTIIRQACLRPDVVT
jgi:hypothetical protein